MLSRFFPKEFHNSVFEINYEALFEKGFRGLIFDIDNTLAAFDIPHPPKKVVALVKSLQKIGFRLCLLSNNSAQRVKGFNNSLGLPAIHKAGKPQKRGLRKALSLLKLTKERTAIIGDQLFTDVWGGNRTGIYTILVNPLAKRDEWTVKLKRAPEKLVKNIYFKRYHNTGGN